MCDSAFNIVSRFRPFVVSQAAEHILGERPIVVGRMIFEKRAAISTGRTNGFHSGEGLFSPFSFAISCFVLQWRRPAHISHAHTYLGLLMDTLLARENHVKIQVCFWSLLLSFMRKLVLLKLGKV